MDCVAAPEFRSRAKWDPLVARPIGNFFKRFVPVAICSSFSKDYIRYQSHLVGGSSVVWLALGWPQRHVSKCSGGGVCEAASRQLCALCLDYRWCKEVPRIPGRFEMAKLPGVALSCCGFTQRILSGPRSLYGPPSRVQLNYTGTRHLLGFCTRKAKSAHGTPSQLSPNNIVCCSGHECPRVPRLGERGGKLRGHLGQQKEPDGEEQTSVERAQVSGPKEGAAQQGSQLEQRRGDHQRCRGVPHTGAPFRQSVLALQGRQAAGQAEKP
ncbi:uncharacterized protein [Dermacentor albipictus]|uniref:uncharacterized protein isoform X1 n=1 Tax=Dermacentor albipictus TaxID=60249 RepID=UPI0038FC140A